METMRERFVQVAGELLDERTDLALVLADIGVSGFAAAARRHPDRVVNVGIREQLMIGVAGGMSLEGMRPIVHSYAPFLVERPYEFLKLSLGHQDVGAVLVSIGASYDAAPEGRTHQAPGDVALLSALPGWHVHVPGHPDEAEILLRRAAASTGRHYVRLSDEENEQAWIRGADGLAPVSEGSSAVAVAVGPTLDAVLEATYGLDVAVLYATTVRPFDGATLRRHVPRSGSVVLVEPYLEGTSAHEASSALADEPHRLLSIGVPRRELRRYGTGEEHRAVNGLDASSIRRRIEHFVAR